MSFIFLVMQNLLYLVIVADDGAYGRERERERFCWV